MSGLISKELEKRINGYLARAASHKLDVFHLTERGLYRIMGGTTSEYGDRRELAIVEGRFIDAIVYAVEHKEYVGWWCSRNQYDHSAHGFVKKVKIEKLPKSRDSDEFLKKHGGSAK